MKQVFSWVLLGLAVIFTLVLASLLAQFMTYFTFHNILAAVLLAAISYIGAPVSFAFCLSEGKWVGWKRLAKYFGAWTGIILIVIMCLFIISFMSEI